MKWIAFLGLALPFNTCAAALSEVVARTGSVQSESIALANLSPQSQYSLLYSLSSSAGLANGARVEVEVRQGAAVLASKTLHAGDPDYYAQFRVPQAGSATVVVRALRATGKYVLQV